MQSKQLKINTLIAAQRKNPMMQITSSPSSKYWKCSQNPRRSGIPLRAFSKPVFIPSCLTNSWFSQRNFTQTGSCWLSKLQYSISNPIQSNPFIFEREKAVPTTLEAHNIKRVPDLICFSTKHFNVKSHIKFTTLFCEAKSSIQDSDSDFFKIAKMAYDEAQIRSKPTGGQVIPTDSFSVVTGGSEVVIHHFQRIPNFRFLLRREIFRSHINSVESLVQTFKACWALKTMLEDLHGKLEKTSNLERSEDQTQLTPNQKSDQNQPLLPSIYFSFLLSFFPHIPYLLIEYH